MVSYISKRLKRIQKRICFTETEFFFPFIKLELGFGFGITLRIDDEQKDKYKEDQFTMSESIHS